MFFPLTELPPLLSTLMSQTQILTSALSTLMISGSSVTSHLLVLTTFLAWYWSKRALYCRVYNFFLITQLVTVSCKSSYWVKCYTDIKHIYWPEWLVLSAADLCICSCWRTQESLTARLTSWSRNCLFDGNRQCQAYCLLPTTCQMNEPVGTPTHRLTEACTTSPWCQF